MKRVRITRLFETIPVKSVAWFLVATALAAAPIAAIAADIEANLDSDNGSSSFIVKDSAATPLLKITSLGRVGIGDEFPGVRLGIKGSGLYDGIRVNSSDGNQIFGVLEEDDFSGRLQISDSGGNAMIELRGTGISYLKGGKLGIGTDDPTFTLDIKSAGYTDGMRVLSDDDEQLFRVRQNSDGSAQIQVSDDGGVIGFVAAGTAKVGIGTSTLTHELEIVSDSPVVRIVTTTNVAPVIQMRGGPGSGLTTRQWGRLQFLDPGDDIDAEIAYIGASLSQPVGLSLRTDGVGRMKIKHSGEVGIGLDDPEDVLHVKSTGYTFGMRVTSSDDDLLFRVRQNSSGAGGVYVCDAEGTATVVIDGNTGKTQTKILEITGGADLSEPFDIGDDTLAIEPGMVVSIDPQNPGDLAVSRTAYDRRVAGIVSGAGGVQTGVLMGQRGSEADGSHPVALSGRVYCLCDAAGAAIQPGDLLVSSTTPGHAMKATDRAAAAGAIIGKAMTGLAAGEQGLVLVLVSLQ